MKVDLEDVFSRAMAAHPRTLQEALGPSEIGDPCERKLAFKMSGSGLAGNGAGLPAWIGTQAHRGAQDAFEADNQRLRARRWITEQRVHVGRVLDLEIDGTLDLFDTWTGTVIDFKFVGPTTLKNVRVNGISEVYRTQVHCYGLGMSQAQEAVKQVGVYFLPRDGQLRGSRLITEPYDEGVARKALARMERILSGLRAHGEPMRFPTAESYCHTCPFYSGGTTDPRAKCPGHGDQAMTLTFTE